MARKSRVLIPGMLYHIIHKGHNDGECFFNEQCYRFYLKSFEDAINLYDGKLHAYVLLNNLVHILITPASSKGIPRIMQTVGSRYTQYANKRFQRTGTLWDGRYKSCLVCAEEYLISCQLYIEYLPVLKGLVKNPGEYRWSSYCANALGYSKSIVTPHPIYINLGEDIGTRCTSYRILFNDKSKFTDLRKLGDKLEHNKYLGDSNFRLEVEKKLGSSLGYSKCGRPRKVPDELSLY